ncbi:hypothetical protein [Ereboglobus luteus]|uniref:amino acid kinase family protein n=1 Tax=Ereboglobus luteus TaxID=1796921 RepID=UPI0030842289
MSNVSTSPAPAATATTIKPVDLRGILKYVPRFKDQIFVIALDGAIIADENFGNLLVDIAVLRSLGIKVVLVHGIGKQLRELSELRRVPITDEAGTGVADAATLDLAIRASSRVSHVILEGLTQNAIKCAITNAVRALPSASSAASTISLPAKLTKSTPSSSTRSSKKTSPQSSRPSVSVPTGRRSA